jgi:nicotinate-nucleotide pyrophosphorylase (carboxylating)
MLPFSARRIIESALDEDLGLGDVTTSAVVPVGLDLRAAAVARERLVVCGSEIAAHVFWRLEGELVVEIKTPDGDTAEAGQAICEVSGSAAAILAGERVALNLLQHLSGIATTTREYVDAVAGQATFICETRKTTPGLRELEKFAVRCGGGRNHRASLADCVLIKDNHIALCGGVAAAIVRARSNAPHTATIDVETDTLEQVAAAADAGADVILLDNMDANTVAAAVALVAGRSVVEVSGGVTLDQVGAYASAGADVVSIGALTHSRKWVDIGLDYIGR